MKILILGGDGFCGWPTSLYLSSKGHEIHVVDDFSRRAIDIELQVESLTPIRPLSVRLDAWKRVSGKAISYSRLDVVNDYEQLKDVISSFNPDAVVHFAEQKSAPYSMKSSLHKRITVAWNTGAATSLACALIDCGIDAHIVHLGTMGVYGYHTDGLSLPEGYVMATLEDGAGRTSRRRILHPFDPGSVYHMTKTLDALIFGYFNKQDGIRVTDLHQGIVWGTATDQTTKSDDLVNRFDYDGDFGTVLNRFIIQAAVGVPLTVHGAGRQKRAFINIRDTVRCIELAIENSPKRGEPVAIFNQMTEVFRVNELAALVSRLTGAAIGSQLNPRTENENNELDAEHDGLINLGLDPTRLEEGLVSELVDIAGRYKDRVDPARIPCVSAWSHTFKI